MTALVRCISVLMFLGTGLVPAAQAAQNYYDCDDFATRDEAQAVLDADPSDRDNLDADGDGIACEPYAGDGGSADTDGVSLDSVWSFVDVLPMPDPLDVDWDGDGDRDADDVAAYFADYVPLGAAFGPSGGADLARYLFPDPSTDVDRLRVGITRPATHREAADANAPLPTCDAIAYSVPAQPTDSGVRPVLPGDMARYLACNGLFTLAASCTHPIFAGSPLGVLLGVPDNRYLVACDVLLRSDGRIGVVVNPIEFTLATAQGDGELYFTRFPAPFDGMSAQALYGGPLDERGAMFGVVTFVGDDSVFATGHDLPFRLVWSPQVVLVPRADGNYDPAPSPLSMTVIVGEPFPAVMSPTAEPR